MSLSAVPVVSGNFTGTGQSASYIPKASVYNQTHLTKFNWSIWGTFVGTVVLEKSFDNGTTWIQAFDQNGNALSTTAPKTIIVEEPEDGVLYRARCSAFTSGTINYRMSR